MTYDVWPEYALRNFLVSDITKCDAVECVRSDTKLENVQLATSYISPCVQPIATLLYCVCRRLYTQLPLFAANGRVGWWHSNVSRKQHKLFAIILTRGTQNARRNCHRLKDVAALIVGIEIHVGCQRLQVRLCCPAGAAATQQVGNLSVAKHFIEQWARLILPQFEYFVRLDFLLHYYLWNENREKRLRFKSPVVVAVDTVGSNIVY